jgi:hypothetical protein
MSKGVEENKNLKGDDTNDKKRAKISKTSSNKSNKSYIKFCSIIQFKLSGNSLYVYEIKKER